MTLKQQILHTIETHPQPGSRAAMWQTFLMFRNMFSYNDFRKTVGSIGYKLPSDVRDLHKSIQ